MAIRPDACYDSFEVYDNIKSYNQFDYYFIII